MVTRRIAAGDRWNDGEDLRMGWSLPQSNLLSGNMQNLLRHISDSERNCACIVFADEDFAAV